MTETEFLRVCGPAKIAATTIDRASLDLGLAFSHAALEPEDPRTRNMSRQLDLTVDRSSLP